MGSDRSDSGWVDSASFPEIGSAVSLSLFSLSDGSFCLFSSLFSLLSGVWVVSELFLVSFWGNPGLLRSSHACSNFSVVSKIWGRYLASVNLFSIIRSSIVNDLMDLFIVFLARSLRCIIAFSADVRVSLFATLNRSWEFLFEVMNNCSLVLKNICRPPFVSISAMAANNMFDILSGFSKLSIWLEIASANVMLVLFRKANLKSSGFTCLFTVILVVGSIFIYKYFTLIIVTLSN